jgi:hypothetical protein
VEIASTKRKSKETDPTIVLTNLPAGTHSEYKPFSSRLHYEENAQNQSFALAKTFRQKLIDRNLKSHSNRGQTRGRE